MISRSQFAKIKFKIDEKSRPTFRDTTKTEFIATLNQKNLAKDLGHSFTSFRINLFSYFAKLDYVAQYLFDMK